MESLVSDKKMAENFLSVLVPKFLQDAQKGYPARPQQAKRRGAYASVR